MAVEGAAFLVAVGRIKRALVFWATVGKPLNFGMMVVRSALGPLPRSSKIYDFRHSFAFVALVQALPDRWTVRRSGGRKPSPQHWPAGERLLLVTLSRTVAKFQYTVS